MKSLLLLLAATAVSGCCEVYLNPAHGPPPGATSSIDRDEHRIELSAGTAMAIECTINDSYRCDNLEVVGDDESLMTLYPMHLQGMQEDWLSVTDRSAFVVVARRPGTATLEVRTDDADATYRVEITPE